MTDIWVCWFGVEENGVHATRDEVRAAADRLGLTGGEPVRDRKGRAFRQACRIVTSYTDEHGQDQQISASVTQRREFNVARLQRGDGFKLAEWKLFSSKLTRAGIPQGTTVLTSALRARLGAVEKTAVAAWLAQASEVYEQLCNHAPAHALRYEARRNLLTVAVPILKHNQMYFGYGEGAPEALRVQELLQATCTGYDFTLLPIQAGADVSRLAVSADAHLHEQLADTLVRLMRARLPAARPLRPEVVQDFRELLARVRLQALMHERRLRASLPHTMTALAQCEHVMAELPPGVALVPAPREHRTTSTST